MVQHPRGEDGVEACVRERELLDVGHVRIDASGPGQLDHARRLIDRRRPRTELVAVSRSASSPSPQPTSRTRFGRDLRDGLERKRPARRGL